VECGHSGRIVNQELVMPVLSILFRACCRRVAAAGLILATILIAAAVVSHRATPESYTFQYEGVLGTSMDLTLVAASDAVAARAEAAVLASIDRDASILSAWDPGSEFSRWMGTSGVPTPVSAELAEVLSLFDTWRARTGGALDPAVARVSQVWTEAAARDRAPAEADLAVAVAEVRRTHWVVDADARTATRVGDTPLVLASFTKSYIVDRAARAALAAGATGVVVNVGGDIVVRGAVRETVALRDPGAPADNASPMAELVVSDKAVATSGGYRRGFDIGGRHYSHIVDPRTGQPAGHVLSATVVAPNAVDAGALATAMCVLSPDESARLAAQVPGVEYLLVLAGGERLASAGWQRQRTPRPDRFTLPSPVAALHAAQRTWDPAFELAVTLELARPGGRARRPYVAVWIEDKDRQHVRTLALWVARPRWLPDLRAWYRADRTRAQAEGTDLVSTVSSATRAPGRYTLSWDGMNQQGKPVSPGTYTVYIEAAREHGTYQLMRQDVTVGGAVSHVDIPGGAEVSAASIDYRSKGGQ
jgi:thiamine biosynthesis lipoprotein ApbE